MTDDATVKKLFDRDERALSEVKQKYGNYCRSIANNILSDSRDAEECVNDALLAVWNSIPPNRPENLKTYITIKFNSTSDAKERLNMSVADIRAHYFELQRRLYNT